MHRRESLTSLDSLWTFSDNSVVTPLHQTGADDFRLISYFPPAKMTTGTTYPPTSFDHTYPKFQTILEGIVAPTPCT